MRLRTLGGLWIEGETAPSLGARPLALLALAAAAGKKGVSRDRVVGILWSEASEEQARHTLSQTLYNLRREARGDLIAGTTHLRLEPGFSSDIGDLREAAQNGDLETVGRLYTGKFLEGFYLPGAPEFERWVEEEQAGLHREVQRAIERLVKFADEAAKPAESVRWWQRLTELDPLSARYAAGHMQALVAVGDRSGALARARLYRETVHRELNAEPDRAVQELEQRLRAASAVPVPPPPAASTASASTEPRRQPHRAPWLLPAGVLVVVVVLGLAARGFGIGRSPSLPFLAVGEVRINSPDDTTRLGSVLRDMLATSLGGVEGLQVVANSRLVELMPRGPDPSSRAIADAARRAGATEIIEGELSVESAGLTLSLRRVTLERGVVRRGYVVRAANRPALIDSAAAAIARDLKLTSPSVTAAQIRTSSPAAHALYDEGLRAYYGYDAPAAFRLMKAALARDSNFAMAAYYVWHLSGFAGDDTTGARVLPQVKRLALRTIERERLLIQTSVAELEASLPTAAALAETLTVKYPDDPDGQILLGLVRHNQGDWAGSVAAYERSLALDSIADALSGPYCRVCRTLTLMVQAYVWWDSAGAAERTARRLIALRPTEPGPWAHLPEPLFRLGRRVEAEEAFTKTTDWFGTGSGNWHTLQRRDLLRWGSYDRADRQLTADIQSPVPRIHDDAWWLLLLSLRDQGRLREADTLIHRRRVPNTGLRLPASGPEPADLAFLALEMGRPNVSVRAHRENVANVATWSIAPALRARNLIWQLTLAGTAHAAAGDTTVVRHLIDSLEVLGPTSNYGRDAKLHYFLRGLLFQQQGRHAEAVDAFRRSLYSLTDGYTRTNLMLGRSLLAIGRGREAIVPLRAAIHGGVDGSNTYVSRTELHEALAQAFEQEGQADSARVHWRAVESAWRHADPQFRDRYLNARQRAGV